MIRIGNIDEASFELPADGESDTPLFIRPRHSLEESIHD